MNAGICFCSPGNHFLLLFPLRRRTSVRRSNTCWMTSTRVPRIFWDDGMTIWHGTGLPMLSSPFRSCLRIHRLPTRVTWSGDSSPTRPRGQRPNWEMVARATLAEFRTASARYPGDPWFEELIEELKQVSPEFCRWWPHHDVRSALDGHKVIEHPTLGSLEFEHFTLQVLTNPDIRIMIYTPSAVTRTTLQHLLATATGSDPNSGASTRQQGERKET